jgi:hypothetical protein
VDAPARSARSKRFCPRVPHLLEQLWRTLPADVQRLLVDLLDLASVYALRRSCRYMWQHPVLPGVRTLIERRGLPTADGGRSALGMYGALHSQNPRMLAWMAEECRWFSKSVYHHMAAMKYVFPEVMTPLMIQHYRWDSSPSSAPCSQLAHSFIKLEDKLPCLQALVKKLLDIGMPMFRKAWRHHNLPAVHWLLETAVKQGRSSMLRDMQRCLRSEEQCRDLVDHNDLYRLEWLWQHSKLALGVKRWPVEELLQLIAVATPDFCEWLLRHYPRYMRNFLESSVPVSLSMEWLSSTRDFSMHDGHLPSLQWAVGHGARFDYEMLLDNCHPVGYTDQQDVLRTTARTHAWITERMAAAV